MPLTSLWQFLLPDSLLLEIFTYLKIKDLGHAAQVCTSWRRVAYDELLWQKVARTRWKIKGPIHPGRHSWRSEVKRLVHHAPCIRSEIFTDAHIDEVLDVSMSHGGDYFCTTSKDSCIILWRLGFPSTQVNKVKTQDLFNWSLTQYSKFNSNDSLLLVCGVLIPDDLGHFLDTSLGRGAIFTVPDLRPIQIVNLDPPTLFGAWLTPDVFVGGNLQGLPGAIRIEAHKVPDVSTLDPDFKCSSVPDTPEELFYFRGDKHHQMSILVADVQCFEDTQCNSDNSHGNESACSTLSALPSNQPSNLYDVLNTENESGTAEEEGYVSKGAGDFRSCIDSLVKKKRRGNSKEESLSSQETRFVNPNIKEVENNASFWDILGSADSLDHGCHWRSKPSVSSSSSESECKNTYHYQNGFHGYKPDQIMVSEVGTYSSITGEFLSDNSETPDLVVCKKTRLDHEQETSEGVVNAVNSESHLLFHSQLRISGSDTTVSSQEFSTDSGSISIAGLSSSSEIYSDSHSDIFQTEHSHSQLQSSNADYSGSDSKQTDGSSESVLIHSDFSGDKFYNTDLHTGRSTSTLVETELTEQEIESPTKSFFDSLSRSCSNRQGNFKKFICFVSGAHDAIVVQEVTVGQLESLERRLARKDSQPSVMPWRNGEYDKKDHYFFIRHCYITGMCLSQDHRFIYFNYREWDRQEGEESDDDMVPDDPLRDVSDRRFGEHLKVGVIDLITMRRIDLTYEGHIGYSSYPAWYICLGASEDYLGSGSENARAYLWDRYYRVILAELHHTEMVVNGLVFSPVDQECCVTVCDDRSIIVWRSRNKMSELKGSVSI